MNYKNLSRRRGTKTNPIQTQYKPNFFKAQNERKSLYHKGLQKKRPILLLKKSAKRFDFDARLGYNIYNKVPMEFGGGHLNNRVLKDALFVKLKLIAN